MDSFQSITETALWSRLFVLSVLFLGRTDGRMDGWQVECFVHFGIGINGMDIMGTGHHDGSTFLGIFLIWVLGFWGICIW